METKYNYFEAEVNNIETYIAENEIRVVGSGAISRDDLYDELMNSDYVTGNLSGSYTFSRWQAAEYVCHNLDLLDAALTELYGQNVPVRCVTDPEWCDVIIRCYLLDSCLNAVLDGIKEDVSEYYESHNMEE